MTETVPSGPPVVMRMVYAIIDKRTTLTCLHAAGQIRLDNELFNTLSGDFYDTPFHIECRSNIGPWVPGMGYDIADAANNEIAQRPFKDRRIGPDEHAKVPPPSRANPPGVFPLVRRSLEGVTPTAVDPLGSSDAIRRLLDLAQGLPPDQRDALGWYVRGGYVRVNEAFRFGEAITGALAGYVAALEAALGTSTVTGSAIVIYAAASAGVFSTGSMAGMTLADLGFLTGSTSAASATSAAGSTGTVIEIIVPAGSPALALDGGLVMLGRSTDFLVLSDTVRDGVRWLTVEVVA